jgi:hypothetical protein
MLISLIISLFLIIICGASVAVGDAASAWSLVASLEARGLPARDEFWEALPDEVLGRSEDAAKQAPPEPSIWERTTGSDALEAARSAFSDFLAAAGVVAAESAAAPSELTMDLYREWEAALAGSAASACTSTIRLAEWRLFYDSFALPRAAVAAFPRARLRVPAPLARAGRLDDSELNVRASVVSVGAGVLRSEFEKSRLGGLKADEAAAAARRRGGAAGLAGGDEGEEAREGEGEAGAADGDEDGEQEQDLFSPPLSPRFGAADDDEMAPLRGRWESVDVSFATQDDALRALALGVGLCHAALIEATNTAMGEAWARGTGAGAGEGADGERADGERADGEGEGDSAEGEDEGKVRIAASSRFGCSRWRPTDGPSLHGVPM